MMGNLGTVPSVPEAIAHLAAGILTPDDLAKHLETMDFVLPMLAVLAANSDVTREAVMKTAADAVGAGKITAADRDSLTAGMPDQPDDLRPWLQNLYHTNIIWSVALYAYAHKMIGDPKGMIQ